jgi:hypothetical protein
MASHYSHPAGTLAADLALAWEAIEAGTVDQDARFRSWRLWVDYLAINGIPDRYLRRRDPAEQLSVILAFAAKVRTGDLGMGARVQLGSVSSSLRHVGQMFELAGFRDPRKPQGTAELHLAISRMYRAYQNQDPPPRSQIALPVEVFQDLAANEGRSNSLGLQATSDLIVIAFFFLFRVGEYTPAGTKKTRTVQFRLCDMTFWKRQGQHTIAIAYDAPDQEILDAISVTYRLDNQKNTHRDDTLSHDRAPDDQLDPVRASARRFLAARALSQGNRETLICKYSPTRHITARTIQTTLLRAAKRCNLSARGYDYNRIGTHSIRAAGAMALYLNKVDPSLIQLMGRWRSQTWLTYIHSQIAATTQALSRIMGRPILFHNTAARTA